MIKHINIYYIVKYARDNFPAVMKLLQCFHPSLILFFQILDRMDLTNMEKSRPSLKTIPDVSFDPRPVRFLVSSPVIAVSHQLKLLFKWWISFCAAGLEYQNECKKNKEVCALQVLF